MESPESTPSKLSTKTLKIAIAEDHDLSRDGLSLSLQKKTMFEICGEAENGQVALKIAETEQPEVFIMDIGMPIMDGIAATQAIKKQWPEMKVIMLTSHNEGEEVFAALAAGADAYCLKDIKLDRLVQVIEMVAEGAVYLDPAIAALVLQSIPLAGQAKTGGAAYGGATKNKFNVDLTHREQEVLELIVAGKSNKEIANDLCITIHTVKAHVCNIIQKLAVDDRTQAAVKALRDGLVVPTD